MIYIVVLWVVRPCSLVGAYSRFGRAYHATSCDRNHFYPDDSDAVNSVIFYVFSHRSDRII